MLYIKPNGEIQLTRGDTAYIQIAINIVHSDGTSEAYTIGENDTLYMSAKESVESETYAFQKVITGANTFHIVPSDTEGLEFGKYVYDVQLVTEAGDVYTVVEPSAFYVMSEVTTDEQ